MPTTLDNPMTALEVQFGLQPIGDLLEERGVLVGRLAPLWAKYGPGGTAEHQRSAELARIDGLLRAMAATDPDRKVTEASLEKACRAHPDYLALVALHTTERAEYFKLDAQIQAIDFRINRGQGLTRLIGPGGRNG